MDRDALDRLRRALVQEHGKLRGHLRQAATAALEAYARKLEVERDG